MLFKNSLTILKARCLLQDLNRQVVKSDAASFTIPELEFESPAFSQNGGKVENSSFIPVVLAFGQGRLVFKFCILV